MTTLGPNVEKFKNNPDQYVLYTRKGENGNQVIDASEKGIGTWLMARLAFWRSYSLPSIMKALENYTSQDKGALLIKLEPKITKYNKKPEHSQTQIIFSNIFPKKDAPKIPQDSSVNLAPQPKQSEISEKKAIIGIPSSHETAKGKRTLSTSKDIASENSIIDISTLQPPKGMKCAKQAFLYSYYAQDSVEETPLEKKQQHVEDYGWGCAWRAIQTCLSSLIGKNKVPRFESLYYFYGDEEKLKELYKDKWGNNLIYGKTKNAPHSLDNGWAEPFIGEMVLHGYGYEADLFALNGIPGNANSPDEVFANAPVHKVEANTVSSSDNVPKDTVSRTQKGRLNFGDFTEKLNEHFSKETPAPVMIDNGVYAMNIIGCRLNSDATTTLWISDTHINGGSTKAKDTKPPVSVYSVTLGKTGERISFEPHDPTDEKRLPQGIRKLMYSDGAASESLDFRRPWMVLFPGGKKLTS